MKMLKTCFERLQRKNSTVKPVLELSLLGITNLDYGTINR